MVNKKIVEKKVTPKKVEKKIEEEIKKEIKVKTNVFKDLENKFLLVKVGNDLHPANDPQIKDIEEKLGNLLEEHNINCLSFVTHHYVDFQIIEKK